jgi:glucokinase
VSYDQILSQRGLVNLYQFLKNTGQGQETVKTEVTADVIIQEALANPTDKNNLCTQALGLFVSILGAEAGNLALKYYALGGVYIGGAMAPKIVTKLQDGTFMTAFKDRENKTIAELLVKTPVKVVTNPKIMLFGAAQRALEKELMGKALYAQCTR